MPPLNARFFRDQIGFSLVEILVAIGLVTFAFLVVFSLMPVGMAALQDTSRQLVETEIFNTIGAELTSTPFEKLDDYVKDSANPRFPAYFDYEGNEVAAKSAVYIVRCQLTDPELGAGELRRASVLIGYRKDPNQLGPGDPKPSKRTFLLVNRGI